MVTDVEILKLKLEKRPILKKYHSAADIEENSAVVTEWLPDSVTASTTEKPSESGIKWWNNILEVFRFAVSTTEDRNSR